MAGGLVLTLSREEVLQIGETEIEIAPRRNKKSFPSEIRIRIVSPHEIRRRGKTPQELARVKDEMLKMGIWHHEN